MWTKRIRSSHLIVGIDACFWMTRRVWYECHSENKGLKFILFYFMAGFWEARPVAFMLQAGEYLSQSRKETAAPFQPPNYLIRFMAVLQAAEGQEHMGIDKACIVAGVCLLTMVFAPHPLSADSSHEPAAVAGPHESLACEDCHVDNGKSRSSEVGKSCERCHHDQTGTDSHPSDVPYTGSPPKDLPLSKEGKVVCTTCHVLHKTNRPAEKLMRKPFNELCMTCHYPPGQQKDGHGTSGKSSH